MKTIIRFLGIVLVLMILMACRTQVDNDQVMPKTVKTFEGVYGQEVNAEQTWTLRTGEDYDAGTLTVANNGKTLFVTFKTLGSFGYLHLWVGTDIALLPTDAKGIPLHENFPYMFAASGLNEFTFEIPLREIKNYRNPGNSLFVVSEAEVLLDGNDEIGYGGELQANEKADYWYGKYVVR